MIILVRHGQTFWNVERRIQGHSESPLTPLGERQAAAMADLVADLVRRQPGPWRLVSSPIGRARQTAAAVSTATGLPVEFDVRLMEICCGSWEGELWDDVIARHPELDGSGDRFYASYGGETYDDVSRRAYEWLASLAAEPERRVIAVSHGVLGRLLRGAYAGLDREATNAQHVPQDAVYRLQNGQIDRFDCEPVE
jgi:broad specificity phosphatase PhoE